MLQIEKEITNERFLLRRCQELMELQAQREKEILGNRVDLQDASDSERSDSCVSESSTIMSMSELGEDFQSFTRKSISINGSCQKGKDSMGLLRSSERRNSATDEEESVHITSPMMRAPPAPKQEKSTLDTINEAVSTLKDIIRRQKQKQAQEKIQDQGVQ